MRRCLFVLAGLALAAPRLAAQQPAPTPLTGRWVLDTAQSDLPRRSAGRLARGGDGPGAMLPDDGWRGEGGPVRMGGPGMRGMRVRAPRPGLLALLDELRPARDLELALADTLVTITEGILTPRSYPLTGRAVREPANDPDEVTLETKARLRNGVLEVARKVGKAGTVTRRYVVEPVTGQLVVTLEVDGLPGPTREPRRLVYERRS